MKRRAHWVAVAALWAGGAFAQSGQMPTFSLSLAQRTHDLVAQTVETLYYDVNKLKALQWPSLVAQSRAGLTGITSSAQFYRHVSALLDTLDDSHTRLVLPDEARQQVTLAISVEGRGLRLGERRGELFVRELTPDSPAARSGLLLGERIVTIDGESAATRFARALELASVGKSPTSRARETALAQVLSLQRERPLVLEVISTQTGELRTVRITDQVTAPPALVQITAPSVDVTSLKLRRFRNDASPTLQKFFDNAQPRGLVIDLRGNDGGDLLLAFAMLERLFTRPAEIGVEITRAESLGVAEPRERMWRVTGQVNARTEPLAVLIDERCASACEVFAAALKENRRARVFGHTSAGVVAGIAPRPVALPDGSGLNVSLSGILGPNRLVLDNVGVSAHESCEVTTVDLSQGIDCVERLAMRWLASQIAY
jgi:carboxyl-terminal processing protease